jgi:tetratricopeptide (TPR) repeat protein
MIQRRRALVLVSAATVVVAGLLAVSVQRVPGGHVAICGVRPSSAGWLLHRPGSKCPTLPAQGSLDLSSIGFQTKEGSTLGFALKVDYDLSASLPPQLASDIRRAGFEGAVRDMAARVLADVGGRVDTDRLLSDPASVEQPLRVALSGAGIGVSRLSFRSELGDELVRRARTDELQKRIRPALGPVIVIGWDGADWETALPLMETGRMPNLSRVVHEGAWGRLRSYDPMFSPLLWTTVATGKAPTEHGIADFLVREGSGGDRRPITSDFRRVKALWNILTDVNRASAWIAWWASYPAESINGLMVTDYLSAALGSKSPDEAVALTGVVSPAGGLARPTALLVQPRSVSRDELLRIIPVSEAQYRAAQDELAQPRKEGDPNKSRVDNPVAFIMRVLAMACSFHNIALSQIKAGVPTVGIYYEGIDMMGHGFQHYLPPKLAFVADAEYERFKDAVPRYYEYQDELLGELLRAAGPDALIMILSDHGFRTGSGRPGFPPSTKGQPEEWHRDWGVLVLHGPGIRAVALPDSSIYDVAPTLLYVLGLPLADDMPGRLVDAAFDPAIVRQRPPAHIRSYELAGKRLEHDRGSTADPAAVEEMMANLRALGYVGGGEGADDETPVKTGDQNSETQYFYHRNLAVQYIRQGRFGDAEAELLAANDRKPQGKTYEMLSQVRASQGRYADAVGALREGWERVPELMEPASLLWMVELELLAGDNQAAGTVTAAWANRLTPALRLAIDGRLRDAAGDAAGASDAYRRALAEDPLIVRVAQRLHELDAARGEPFAIEPFLLQTLERHPEVDAFWDMAGQLALARGDYPSAAERFKKANALQPDDGLYLGHLASALAAAGRVQDARAALDWAARFPPSSADAWMALGAAWDRVGDADRAVAAFGSARSAGLKGPGADLGSALALARAGRTAEAQRILTDASARFPESAAVKQVQARLRH